MPKTSPTKHQISTDVRNMQLRITGTLANVPYGAVIDVGNGKAEWDGSIPWREPTQVVPGAEGDCVGCGSVVKKLIKGGLGWAKELLHVDQAATQIAAERRSICLDCPSVCYDFGICRDDWPDRPAAKQGCGCILAMKVTQKSEACPHDHWGSVNG